jgi:hypothetical protein
VFNDIPEILYPDAIVRILVSNTNMLSSEILMVYNSFAKALSFLGRMAWQDQRARALFSPVGRAVEQIILNDLDPSDFGREPSSWLVATITDDVTYVANRTDSSNVVPCLRTFVALNESTFRGDYGINNVLQNFGFVYTFLCVDVSWYETGNENPKSTIPYIVHMTFTLSANLQKA